MRKLRLALAVGVVSLMVSGLGQASSSRPAATSDEGSSIVRVEILLHDPDSDPPGNRDVIVTRSNGKQVWFHEEQMDGDGTEPVKKVEDLAVAKACKASEFVCRVLTRTLIVEIGYR